MPIYNGQAYVAQALQSLLAQTYRPLEVVLIDDGSTDQSLAVVHSTVAQSAPSDIEIVMRSRANGGLSSARNEGVRLATGDVIGFMDHDDFVPAWRTTVLMRGLVEKSADLAFGLTKRFGTVDELPADGPEPALSFRVEERPPYFKMFPNIQGFLATRELLANIGDFRLDLNAAEDVDYVIRIRLSARLIVRTDGVCYYYRRAESSMTSSISGRFLDSKVRFADYAADALVAAGRCTAAEGAALAVYLRGCTSGFLNIGDRAGVMRTLVARKNLKRKFGNADSTFIVEALTSIPGGIVLMKSVQRARAYFKALGAVLE